MTPEAGWTGPRKQRLQRSLEVVSMRLKMLVAESTGQMMWRQ
jgi:hypothetical protein